MSDLFSSTFFMEPVDHVLSRLGLCSDRSFKTFLKNHKVVVRRAEDKVLEEKQTEENVIDRKLLVDSDRDLLFVDGQKLKVPPHLYIILNKPENVVSSKVSDSHKTVFDFLTPEIENNPDYKNLHIAGRLDSDSRGLVLLTTNGAFSANLVKPETHVTKVYEVCLKLPVDSETQKNYIEAFSKGIELPAEKKASAFKTQPAVLEFCDKSLCFCRVTLCEGKFRQIRRMFSSLGNEVMDLKRISIGAIELPSELSEGQIMNLSRKSGLLK